MPELNQRSLLYAPLLTAVERNQWTFLVDG